MTNILSLFEQSRNYKSGTVVIHEGEDNRDLYILSEGVLEVSVKGKDKKIVVSEITAPEILGEISFLNGSPRTATVSAKTDVEMFILSYDKVQQEMSEIPSWFRMVLLAFTNRMKSCDAKIKEYDQKVKKLEAEIIRLKKG
ncbi:MAG: cyclic nucleotide-binding domain-containing protein [Deltaproteobacteria bacterium]|jgi:CRP-like cAMP-binding protein|nr:MAG: cyclic nucleotide-binding domain-containing protein [Deltaproteobacteria bacterium]